MTNLEQATSSATVLPPWSSVLAVVAHPDDESFGLGAVLDALATSGTRVSVLCLTRGEASTVHGVSGDLSELRAVELRSAASALGVDKATLCDYPDDALGLANRAALADEVRHAVRSANPDHTAATRVAVRAAASLGLPVLAWTLPVAVADALNDEFGTRFVGHDPDAIDVVLPVYRSRQRLASLAHASQAVPTSVLWRRLELLGNFEYLRWLRAPAPASESARGESSAGLAPDGETMRVVHRGADQFDVEIRDHRVTVDQPVDIGGEDAGPTPTELFVAGLASCVAFYARRYLRRHNLDDTGLAVHTSYRLGTKPARVTSIDMAIEVPGDLPEDRRDALLAMARRCTVHNSITTAPEIAISLGVPVEAGR